MQSAANEKKACRRLVSFSQRLLASIRGSKSGATSIEYGLICSLIFLVIVASVKNVATQTVIMHTKIQNATQ